LIDNFEREPQKTLFYAAKTLQNGWSRAVLENMIGDKGKNNGLYERLGRLGIKHFFQHFFAH